VLYVCQCVSVCKTLLCAYVCVFLGVQRGMLGVSLGLCLCVSVCMYRCVCVRVHAFHVVRVGKNEARTGKTGRVHVNRSRAWTNKGCGV